MASLRRKTGSKFWFACITLPDGRQTQRSTKEISRSRAQKIADGYERIAKQQMSEAQVRRVMSDIFEQVSGTRLANSTVREYYTTFIAHKKGECSKATYSKYQQVVGEFLAFMGERADRDINFITVNDVIRFRDSYAARLSPVTVNVNLKCVRAFLQAAWRAGLVTENVAAKVSSLKSGDESSKRRAFTIPEMKKVLEAAGDSEWQGIALFGLYTGQRLGDIASLLWSNIGGLGGPLPEVHFKTRKTGRSQSMPLASPLVRYLTEDVEVNDDPRSPIFPRAHAVITGADRSGTLSNAFYDLLVAAGLASPRSKKSTGRGRSIRRQTNELSFHSFRHTATTLMKQGGISAAVVQDIIGHDSPAVSAHYTHVETNAKLLALDTLPDLLHD